MQQEMLDRAPHQSLVCVLLVDVLLQILKLEAQDGAVVGLTKPMRHPEEITQTHILSADQ